MQCFPATKKTIWIEEVLHYRLYVQQTRNSCTMVLSQTPSSFSPSHVSSLFSLHYSTLARQFDNMGVERTIRHHLARYTSGLIARSLMLCSVKTLGSHQWLRRALRRSFLMYKI